MKAFKGILLDLDNTLYDYQKAHEPAIKKVFQYFVQLGVSEEDINEAYESSRAKIHHRLKNTAAMHNRLLYLQAVCERLGLPIYPHALEAYRLYWNSFIESIELFDGVDEFFKRTKNIPIAIVTDLTADVQHQKIKELGLAPYIDVLVTSEEAGVEKPDPLIFELAMEKLQMTPDQLLMVGDSFKKDIIGADQLGIQSVWVNHHKEKEDLSAFVHTKEITEFKKILEWL